MKATVDAKKDATNDAKKDANYIQLEFGALGSVDNTEHDEHLTSMMYPDFQLLYARLSVEFSINNSYRE